MKLLLCLLFLIFECILIICFYDFLFTWRVINVGVGASNAIDLIPNIIWNGVLMQFYLIIFYFLFLEDSNYLSKIRNKIKQVFLDKK